MDFLDPARSKIRLPAMGSLPETHHIFHEKDIHAVNAALAARRPLLVRGEPGTGKSQLARAVAQALGRVLVSAVIDVRTEAQDLQWTFDAVRRLADAQVLRPTEQVDVEKVLNEEKYVTPGPLWWAFNWKTAEELGKPYDRPTPPVCEGCAVENGVVVLLDEIDKADSSVPNSLLECLGNGVFHAPGGPVEVGTPAPLVIVTTNEERALPDPFLRRCLVRHLRVPEPPLLRDWLIARGEAHIQSIDRPVWPELLRRAAELVERDRELVSEQGYTPPGAAEYLDLVRAVIELAESPEHQEIVLEQISEFTLRKHPLELAGE